MRWREAVLAFVLLPGTVLPAAGDVWWSLRPLGKPQVPAAGSNGARGAIDSFIRERLGREGLGPAPEADRHTLIRRVSFDLHGLPPSIDDAGDFLADPSPDAYERLVDRFLASPRYGERWGRHWLDVVHYGETHGYDKDKRRPHAWPFRDWTIRALNEDKPYARFVEEQLAADVLIPEDREAVAALGFIAAGPWDFVGHTELREGTVDKDITRSLDRDDMVATAASTFLSLTVHCARCHDHKFDPITQADYYRLQAVFAGVDRGDRPYGSSAAVEARRDALRGEKKALEDRAKSLSGPAGGAASPSNGYHSAIMADAEHEKWVQVDLGRSRAIETVRLVPARPTDFPDTPGFGFPARWRLEASDAADFSVARRIAEYMDADFANPGDRTVEVPAGGVRARYVRITATRLWPRTGDFVFALAELEVESEGENAAGGRPVEALDSIEAGRWGRTRLVDGYSSRARVEAAARAAGRPEAAPTGQYTAVAREISERLAGVERDLASLPPAKFVYAAAPLPRPRPIHLLERGDVRRPGSLMPPGAIACVAGPDPVFRLDDPNREGARRAALARWIVDPRNPLAWRSIVNRIWHFHFGRGLVDTPNDFGLMGSLPSHPELLDWLAVRFLEEGGSLKRLHRLIVSSAAYRSASRSEPRALDKDADNRFLQRMNRTRLDAESVRDSILAAAGRLDLALGGPPEDHFLFKDDHSPVYDYARFDGAAAAGLRRSVYRTIVRSVPDPFFECLDCADPSILTPRREASVTVLQALALLNDPMVIDGAVRTAERAAREEPSLSARLDRVYRWILSRPPSAAEAKLLAEHAEVHGLASVCRLLFNANEFLFVD